MEGGRVRLAGLMLILPLIIANLIGMTMADLSADEPFTDEETTQIMLIETILETVGISIAAFLVYTAPQETTPPEEVEYIPGYQTSPLPGQLGQRSRGARPGQTPSVVTVPEAADYLRVTDQEILEVIESGQLLAGRVGKQYRITRTAMDDFLAGKGDSTE